MALAFNTKVEDGKGYEQREALEPGTYDAILSAIIDLEHQINDYDKDNPKVEHQIKLLFEIPEQTREVNGEVMPVILSKKLSMSWGERSNLRKVVSALRKKETTPEEVKTMLRTDGGLNELLGKALVLQVESYKIKATDSAGNPIVMNKVTGYSSLRASLAQPQPVRTPFYFEVATPDLAIFKDKLSKWTRDEIMTANNNEEFPAELHKAYRDIKEEENAKTK